MQTKQTFLCYRPRLSRTLIRILTVSFASTVLAVLPVTVNAADIFYDDFSGASGTPLNGLAPDIRPGTEVWKATRVDANGQVTDSSATSCWLSYTFANDRVYALSTTVNFPYTANNGTPIGIAFTKDNPRSTASVLAAASNDYGVLQVKRSGAWAFYGGPDNNATATASAPNNTLFSSGTLTNYEIKLILTTSSTANWTLTGYFNGVQVDLNPGDTGSMTYSFAAQPFTGVGFNFGSTTNDFQSFTLSTIDAVPLIFTSTKAAVPGDLITLHGARFVNGATQPQVWIDQITGTTDVPNPETQMTIASSSSTLIHAQIPPSLPIGLYAVFVNCGGAISAPVWVNKSEAWQILDLVGSQCDPNRVFRITGWNVDLPGATPVVYFQNTSTGVRTSATAANLDDANILTITAPGSIVPGQSYQLVVSNGYGGTQGETYGPTLSCVATPVDALGLGVPWADEFAFAATNVYNVKTDTRLTSWAVGDGVTNDRPAISAACTAAFNAGGGCVYLPAGTYNLQIPVIELESQSYTVSSGDTATVVADPLYSAGSYTSLTADAVGDYVSFTANIPLAGTYDIYAWGKSSPTQGKVKLLIDGVQVGGSWEQYNTAVARDSTNFGSASLTAGNHTFKFEVTGKNAASTGYNIALDSVIPRYALKPNKRVVLRGAGIDVTTLLTDIEPYAVHGTNGSVFHNGTLDMTVKGSLAWNTGSMLNAGPVIVARVKVDNPGGNGALNVNSGKLKTLVKDCILSSGGSCFQGIGTDNLLVKNCTLQWNGGRIVAYTGHDIQVDGCTMTRKVSSGSGSGNVTYGGWEVSKRDNLAILNCVFNKTGTGPLQQNNDGETILNQGVPRLGAGMVTSANATTFTDNTRVVTPATDPQVIPLGWTTDQLVAANAYAVIVAGTGEGQWRKIIANTIDTVTVDTPWDIIPSTDSAYTITWKDEHWLIANNSFQNCPRATWLYSCSMTDVAVVNNDYINCMDIYLRSDQRLTDEHGRFSVFRNVLVAGNEMINTDHVYASQMSCHGALPSTETCLGNPFWDVTFRNNSIDSIRPSLTTGNAYGVNGEGYFAICVGMGGNVQGLPAVKGVLFDKNLAYDLDKAFHTTTGAMQTTIWKPVLSNVGTIWTDVILSGATQGSVQTVVQP